MPIFYAIAAMSENRVIGDHGKIPWHIPDDFRWFKHKTLGATILMGRVTYESIGRPLPGRKTVVFSRHSRLPDNIETCPDITQYLLRDDSEPCWICGGSQIYFWTLDYCRYLYLTRVRGNFPGDTRFPEFEDKFVLDQVIHETPQFRVERWINTGHDAMQPQLPRLPFETWPLQKGISPEGPAPSDPAQG
jgi:dihydrofolate reductase